MSTSNYDEIVDACKLVDEIVDAVKNDFSFYKIKQSFQCVFHAKLCVIFCFKVNI